MNLAEALAWAADELKEHDIEDVRLEAELLLAFSLRLPRTKLVTQTQMTIRPNELKTFKALIARRIDHEPTAYITGFQPFLGLDCFVDRSVLIPRPETELLVETVLNSIGKPETERLGFQLKPRRLVAGFNYTIVDIGTGSGCIAVSLAKKLPNAFMIGIDSSTEALQVARKNAERHGVTGRCEFIQGDMFGPLKEKVDVIVSNPPYIPSAEIDDLQPEVRDWEPREALDGGPDGLSHIRRLIEESPEHLKSGGLLCFEFGFDQAAVIKEAAAKRFSQIEIIRDYSGIERIFVGVLDKGS